MSDYEAHVGKLKYINNNSKSLEDLIMSVLTKDQHSLYKDRYNDYINNGWAMI